MRAREAFDHHLHREKYRANFGLYFNLWDRLIGANHADYEMHFNRVHGVEAEQVRGALGTSQCVAANEA